ncbi:hypothetical protein AB6E53_02335 [Vibrio breoganii]|uniref:Uncharacterized protein n=1 Tax=Vibrio breoganii TaxID=553239 RepID=A0AAP8SWS3_9VIBR|nr:hypothetical protein [Vibrio breoganii]PMP10225.1 hypothetical protein BCS93_11155 [Vibrio breoganii]
MGKYQSFALLEVFYILLILIEYLRHGYSGNVFAFGMALLGVIVAKWLCERWDAIEEQQAED